MFACQEEKWFFTSLIACEVVVPLLFFCIGNNADGRDPYSVITTMPECIITITWFSTIVVSHCLSI